MEERIDQLLILIPALPAAAAILVAILGPRVLRGLSHVPVVVALAAAFVCSMFLLREVHELSSAPAADAAGYERIVRLWTWAEIPDAYELVREGGKASLDNGSKSFRIDITLRADSLTVVMLTMVTFVSTLVAVFAVGYMKGDPGYWRFFAYIGLFVFSMTMLVSVSNFVLLFVFWEAVGVCSYLLIGYWYQKPEAAAAGRKAFLVNRVGDFGFMLGIFLIWTTYGTLNYHDSLASGETDPTAMAATSESATFQSPAEGGDGVEWVRGVLGPSRITSGDYLGGTVGLAICLLLVLGACGKSAQLPLHVWLPDAMEGPTPVSALIHAATMVTAGVYMIARCTPLFMVAPAAQLVVAIIGGLTALMAALIALTQFDLKRVLAYSTISQLGFMFLGLGTGTDAGISGGMFHLFTHAFFKALLFLGAGSVMHAMGNIIDMRRFGGLRRLMPITYVTFFIGCLALSGLVPLSGFWSKDAIVASVEERVHQVKHELDGRLGDPLDEAGVHPVAFRSSPVDTNHESPLAGLSVQQLELYAGAYHWLYFGAIFTSFLTAFYTFRALHLTFHGPQVVPNEAGSHAHESPPVMLVPLGVLAFCAAAVGLMLDQSAFQRTLQLATGTGHWFADFLSHTPSMGGALIAATPQHGEFHLAIAGGSTLVAVAGILLASYFYLDDRREISRVKAILDFEWARQFSDVQYVSGLTRRRWVRTVNDWAERWHLGWLTRLAGQLLLLLLLLLSAPLALGRYMSPYRLSFGKMFFDEAYHALIVAPLKLVAQVCAAVDHWVIDGLVNLLGRVPVACGWLMRSLQTGLVQFYALAMVLGVLVLLLARILWSTA